MAIIHTPPYAPTPTPIYKRFIGSVRRDFVKAAWRVYLQTLESRKQDHGDEKP